MYNCDVDLQTVGQGGNRLRQHTFPSKKDETVTFIFE